MKNIKIRNKKLSLVVQTQLHQPTQNTKPEIRNYPQCYPPDITMSAQAEHEIRTLKQSLQNLPKSINILKGIVKRYCGTTDNVRFSPVRNNATFDQLVI